MNNYYLTDNSIIELWKSIKNNYTNKNEINSISNQIESQSNELDNLKLEITNQSNNISSSNKRIDDLDNSFISLSNSISKQIADATEIIYNSANITSQEQFLEYVKNKDNIFYELSNSFEDFTLISDKNEHNFDNKYKYFILNPQQYYKLNNVNNQDSLNYYYFKYNNIYCKNGNNYIKQTINDEDNQLSYDENQIYYLYLEKGHYEEVIISSSENLQTLSEDIYYISNPNYDIVKSYFYDIFKYYYYVFNSPITYKLLSEELLNYIQGQTINLNVYNSNFNNAYINFGVPGTSFEVENDELAPSIILALADQSNNTISYIIQNNNEFWTSNYWRVEEQSDSDDQTKIYYFSLNYDYPSYKKPTNIDLDDANYLTFNHRIIIGCYNTKTKKSYFKTIENE